jgi:G3E family GTPase
MSLFRQPSAWLAKGITRRTYSRNGRIWNQAGGIAGYSYGGMFWKAVPKKQWPTDKDYLASIAEKWIEPFGDMRQELVFIGQNLDQQAVCQWLDECLLTDAELHAGKKYWTTLEDPFPSWDSV